MGRADRILARHHPSGVARGRSGSRGPAGGAARHWAADDRGSSVQVSRRTTCWPTCPGPYARYPVRRSVLASRRIALRLVVGTGESGALEHGVEQFGGVVSRRRGMQGCVRYPFGLVSELPHALGPNSQRATRPPHRRGHTRSVPGSGRSVMSTGTADDGQTPQQAPEDLVRVREAAPVVGGTPSAVHAWIKRGRLIGQSCPAGRQVSRAAVHALCAPCESPDAATRAPHLRGGPHRGGVACAHCIMDAVGSSAHLLGGPPRDGAPCGRCARPGPAAGQAAAER